MNPKNEISEKVRLFIAKYIHSLEQLEILLLLNAYRGGMWTVPHVQAHVQGKESSVSGCLEDLRSSGFLRATPMPGLVYQYEPKSEDLKKGVDALAAAYKEHKIKVIELVVSKSSDELRNFSNAFKLRRDDHAG
jgi:hypothetical protein